MKSLMLSLLFIFFLTGCKTTNPMYSLTSQTDRGSQSALKGNWRISNVSFPGSDYFTVNSFQIADSKCFIGSAWNFIPNNNKGSMTLNQAGCSAFSSPIVWSINKEGNFILKIVDPGEKSKNIKQGFVLTIANQTDNSFQLIDLINVGGQDKKIVYQFEKM